MSQYRWPWRRWLSRWWSVSEALHCHELQEEKKEYKTNDTKKMKAVAGIVLRILVDIVVLQYIFAKPNRSATAQAAPGSGGDEVLLPQSGQ